MPRAGPCNVKITSALSYCYLLFVLVLLKFTNHVTISYSIAKIEVHASPRVQPVAMATGEKYFSETERNLNKQDRKSVNLEKFKRLDFSIAKQSLNSDLLLRARVLEAMSELKTGNYRLCNECIHHTVKHAGSHSCIMDSDQKTINSEPKVADPD